MEMEDGPFKENAGQVGISDTPEAGVAQENPAFSEELNGKSGPGLERALKSLRRALWILTVLTTFLCASSIVNMVMSKRVHEALQKHEEATAKLNKSLREAQRSLAHLREMIQELLETGEEGDKENVTPDETI